MDAQEAIHADFLRFYRLDVENDIAWTYDYWRLLWQLPYYSGAVAATFQMLMNQAKERREQREMAHGFGRGHEDVAAASAPAADSLYEEDGAPKVKTDHMRKPNEKVSEVPLEVINSLVGGQMIQVVKV